MAKSFRVVDLRADFPGKGVVIDDVRWPEDAAKRLLALHSEEAAPKKSGLPGLLAAIGQPVSMVRLYFLPER